MGMKHPDAGLRAPGVRLVNRTKQIIKADLRVPAGAELEVPGDVAADLEAQTTAFRRVVDVPLEGGTVEPKAKQPKAKAAEES